VESHPGLAGKERQQFSQKPTHPRKKEFPKDFGCKQMRYAKREKN
jgi:hypothetical protein